MNDGMVLYLYMNGKRATSIARTWDDIARLLIRRGGNETCKPTQSSSTRS